MAFINDIIRAVYNQVAERDGYFKTQNYNPIDQGALIADALNKIQGTYGDSVSVKDKAKDLLKWGENKVVGTSRTTIMTLPSGITEETLLTTNAITHLSSDDAADTQLLKLIEGHTISGADLTFDRKTPGSTLTGTTPIALPTPLARATRARLSEPATGNIYFHENTGIVSGVPTDLTDVHMMIPAGEIQTQKASTAISSQDYWIITKLVVGILEKTGTWASARIEIKPTEDANQDWYPITPWYAATDTSGTIPKDLIPYKIVPKNHDVRVSAFANTTNVHVVAGIDGFLAN